MPRCTHCGHEFAVSEGFNCPACARDWRSGGSEAAAAEGGRPAHLALLEGDGAAPPKPRLVSSAGPAVPVLAQPQNDSVPSGWMARLEAARAVAKGSDAAEAAAEAASSAATSAGAGTPAAAPPSTPPPLRAALKKRGGEVEAKPAHLLVAQLEADEKRRRTEQEARRSEMFEDHPPEELISKVEVELPDAPASKRRIPDWVIMGALGVLVLTGIGYAYSSAQKEPTPEAKIDPELAKKAEARKLAIAALETGHSLALEGKARADEAIESYKKALALEPTLASAERGIAIVYAAKDDDANAVRHYQRYLELAPDAKDAPDVKAIIERWRKSKTKKRR